MTVPNPDWLLEEFRAFERTLALRTAIEMDLFTRIRSGANTIPALMAATRASERGLRSLCDFLTIQGHLAKRGARYSLTLSSHLYLTTTSPAYLGSAVKFLAGDVTIAAFCRLRDTVEGGKPSSQDAVVSDWVEYARSMKPIAEPVAAFVADALKVKSAGPIKVLDIGAGHGAYGIAIAGRNSSAEIFAIDSLQVLEIALKNARQSGVAERYHPIPGDALQVGFGQYDLVLAANFAHHLDETSNIQLFRKCRSALLRSGRLVLIDFIPNPDRVSPSPDASFALTLLATTGGEIYTFKQYSEMLRAAGFRSVRRSNDKRGYGRRIITASR